MADADVTQAPTPDETPADQAFAETDTTPKQGFFKTTAGRIILIGGAITLLLGVITVVGFLVITFVFVDAVEETVQQAQEQAQTAAQSQNASGTPSEGESQDGAQIAAGEAYSHQSVRLTGVHVWRDIFQPLVTPISDVLTDTPSGDTTPTGGTSTYQADTLYLLDILTGSSETAAQFYFNAIDYNTTTEFASRDYIVVKEGERLDDTPWRLLSIGVTSVTLQYGDSTVTLSIGQGIRK